MAVEVLNQNQCKSTQRYSLIACETTVTIIIYYYILLKGACVFPTIGCLGIVEVAE